MIRTMVSHGNDDIGKPLLSKIKRQMGFDSTEDFNSYVDCDMSYEAYVTYLTTNGKLKTE